MQTNNYLRLKVNGVLVTTHWDKSFDTLIWTSGKERFGYNLGGSPDYSPKFIECEVYGFFYWFEWRKNIRCEIFRKSHVGTMIYLSLATARTNATGISENQFKEMLTAAPGFNGSFSFIKSFGYG